MAINQILIVKLSAIGDCIHALPVAYALKERFPEAEVTWIVEPPAYDLLTNNPYIDHVIVFEKKKFRSIGGLMKNLPSFSSSLRKVSYDVVLDLQGLGKSAAIAYLSRAPLKLGCCDMREYSHMVSKPVCGPNSRGHIVDRYLDVARALGCEAKEAVFPIVVTEKEAASAEEAVRRAGMNIENPYVVLAVGANWPNKRWPTKYYAKLADWIYRENVIPVVMGGGVVDARLVEEINACAEIPAVDLVDKTTLKEAAHIILKARALVGGDTALTHLAAALKKPAVMLMGPTDAGRNGPYGQLDRAIEIKKKCRHCWKRQCKFKRDCLAEIRVEAVFQQLRKIL